MATNTTADMPLSSELNVLNYLRNITGTSNSGSTYKAATAKATLAPELTSDQMNSIMTEWLRGNGKFLENMQQQNVSGLYNTSTRKLVANDLTAQAALKAATANQDIQKTNAKLSTDVAMKNAELQTSTNAANSKTASSSKNKILDLALAAGMNYLRKDGKKSDKEDYKTSDLGTTTTDAGEGFDYAFKSAQSDANEFLNPSYQRSDVVSDPSYRFSSDFMTGNNSSGLADSLSSLFGATDASFPLSNLGETSSFDFSNLFSASNSSDFSSSDYDWSNMLGSDESWDV